MLLKKSFSEMHQERSNQESSWCSIMATSASAKSQEGERPAVRSRWVAAGASGEAKIKENGNKTRGKKKQKMGRRIISLLYAHTLATEVKAIIQGKHFRSHLQGGGTTPFWSAAIHYCVGIIYFFKTTTELRLAKWYRLLIDVDVI